VPRQEDQPGTGLGLAIVKEIVEAHGGTVKVESSEGEGSVFTFSLPIAGKQERKGRG
jgi:signal transduction histidine kinase